MSAKFNNMLMTGGTFNIAEGDIYINSPETESTVERGINRLFLNVAPGAFHDSGERFDPPKCHPNTRVAVIKEILAWLDDPHSQELVMWLHGAAGAGKSAIAQTIAQMLFEQERLSASFFFARGSTTGRGDESGLVPTLAYQLAKYLPETRAHIATAVLRDPAVFNLTLHSQVQNLLIDPLCITSNALSSSSDASPRLFIIDGLDECRDPDVQYRILQVFVAAIKSMQHHLPQKLLIASRSEIHLLAGFNEHNTTALCRRLPLDNSYYPDADIRLFLKDSFSKIKGEHRMRAYLENSWPSEETISSLVVKSSGQFIYASTVVKYVASARHHPVERLKIILGLKTPTRNDRPFSALDSLYTRIFQNVEDIELVLCILRIALAGAFVAVQHGGPEEFHRHLLGITVEELELALSDLISVISFDSESGWLRFLHASIPDFLTDPYRSGTFYIDQPKVNLYRAKCCVKAICHAVDSKEPSSNTASYSAAWFHLSDCMGRLMDPEDKEYLYQLLQVSSLDMCFALDHHFLELWGSPSLTRDIMQLLFWSLQEHQMRPNKANSLSKLIHQFNIWLMSHLQSITINGFDNSLGIDLMIFTITQIDGDHTTLDNMLNILGISSSQLMTTLDTSMSTGGLVFFPWLIWGYPSQYTEYFKLLHDFFHDPKLSGKYFISGDRYANGALHCMNFLFDTKRTDITHWDKFRWIFERETVDVAIAYATFFLGKAAAAKPLFELLMGTETIPNDSSGIPRVISAIGINARCRLKTRIDILFSIGPRTSGRDSLAVRHAASTRGIDSRKFISADKGVAKCREKSVQMLVTAMSEYVSTKCRSFFLQN